MITSIGRIITLVMIYSVAQPATLVDTFLLVSAVLGYGFLVHLDAFQTGYEKALDNNGKIMED